MKKKMKALSLAASIGLLLSSSTFSVFAAPPPNDNRLANYMVKNYPDSKKGLKIVKFSGPAGSRLYFVTIESKDYCGTAGCKLIVANDTGKGLDILWDDAVLSFKVLSNDQFKLELHRIHCMDSNPDASSCESVYRISGNKLVPGKNAGNARIPTPPEIPAQFHGIWDENKKDCRLDREQSSGRLVVASDEVGGNEYSCSPTKIFFSSAKKTEFSGKFDCSMEGDTLQENLSFKMISDQKLVDQVSGTQYFRCR